MTDPAACWAVVSSLHFRTMALRGKPVIAKGQTLTLKNVKQELVFLNHTSSVAVPIEEGEIGSWIKGPGQVQALLLWSNILWPQQSPDIVEMHTSS